MVKGKGGRLRSVPPPASVENVGQAVANHQRWLIIKMLEQTIIHAPVDTGQFKTDNIASVGLPTYYSLDRYNKDSHEILATGEAALAVLVPYPVVYIQNNPTYADALEDSRPGQALVGIYGVSSHSVTVRHS